MFKNDKRTVVTLDAGGTNFVFGAMRGCEFITDPISYPSNAHDLDLCLATMVKGFKEIIAKLDVAPVAISFAFPGPADYQHGVIGGNLPNFPSFRDGVALGPFLEKQFGLPVFINNDGHLFAYGEAMAGALPEINAKLRAAGSTKQYQNVIGLTFGTGFGCGIVNGTTLITGDNGQSSCMWCLRNPLYRNLIIEESVSIRAIKRVYRENSGDTRELTPKDICDIADGKAEGYSAAAKASFAEFGKAAGDGIATAVSLIDGIVVIGGGITGSARHIMPSLIESMKEHLSMMDGNHFCRIQTDAIWVDSEDEFARFASPTSVPCKIYGTDESVTFEQVWRTPVTISKMGASKAISVGAYTFALNNI